jgi:hypothetical protein
MILKWLKNYPVCMSLGLLTTGLYLTVDEETFRKVMKRKIMFRPTNIIKQNKFKKKQKFKPQNFIYNLLLQVYPATGFEWRTYLLFLYFCGTRLEKALGYRFFIISIFINAVFSILDERNHEKEYIYNPYVLNVPISGIFWNIRFEPWLGFTLEAYSMLAIAYLYTTKEYTTEVGIASILMLNGALRNLKINSIRF